MSSSVGLLQFDPLPESIVKLLNNFLPKNLINEINKFRKREQRQQKLVAWSLLSLLLKENGFDIPDLRHIQRDKYKRPFLPSCPDFNISHTEGMVAVAITCSRRIGIDIEHISSVPLEELRRGFSKTEWSAIAQQADSYDNLYTLWTKKEALVKSEGGALMKWNPEEINLLDLSSYDLAGQRFYFIQLNPGDQYKGWIATTDLESEISVRNYEIEEIVSFVS